MGKAMRGEDLIGCREDGIESRPLEREIVEIDHPQIVENERNISWIGLRWLGSGVLVNLWGSEVGL